MISSVMKKLFNRNPVLFLIGYYVIYLICFFTVERLVTEPVLILYSPIDDMIPFSKYAVLGYSLWFPAILLTLLFLVFCGERKELWRFTVCMMSGMMTCLLFYILVPNGVSLRPPVIEGNDLCAWMMRKIEETDTPMNTCPSIHVMLSVLMDIAWQRSSLLKEKKSLRVVILAIDIIICVSTLFTKQHSIIDVFWGLLYALVLDRFIGTYAEKHYA